MIKNMGKTDKVIRIAAALVLGVLVISGALKGAAVVVFGLIAVALLVTSYVGTCPLYLPFGISTIKKPKE
jgi:hypothetical protein